MTSVRYLFGVLYVLAGLAKAFPSFEDVPRTLRQAATQNAGDLLGPVSQWLANHGDVMTVVVGLALFCSGLCYLFNRLIVVAATGQLLMIACFIAILFNAVPLVAVVDLPFVIVALLLIRRETRRGNGRVPPVGVDA